jgi:hypothetical protein
MTALNPATNLLIGDGSAFLQTLLPRYRQQRLHLAMQVSRIRNLAFDRDSDEIQSPYAPAASFIIGERPTLPDALGDNRLIDMLHLNRFILTLCNKCSID